MCLEFDSLRFYSKVTIDPSIRRLFIELAGNSALNN